MVAFWHERLALMPALWTAGARAQRRGARAYVLVSRHKDGRFIGEMVRRFAVWTWCSGHRTARATTAAARLARATLLGVLQAGGHVVITPDGPRGPRRIAAPGVAELAAWSGAPVVPCAAQTSRRWTLPTWDRMVLPLPFGRGVIVCGTPIRCRATGPRPRCRGSPPPSPR